MFGFSFTISYPTIFLLKCLSVHPPLKDTIAIDESVVVFATSTLLRKNNIGDAVFSHELISKEISRPQSPPQPESYATPPPPLDLAPSPHHGHAAAFAKVGGLKLINELFSTESADYQLWGPFNFFSG